MSAAYDRWHDARWKRIDELIAAHASVGGAGRGRRFRTEQLNFALVVAVAAEFQGFARDLITEAVTGFVGGIGSTSAAGSTPMVRQAIAGTLSSGLELDRGNAHPGALGRDFRRLGIDLWDALRLNYPARAVVWNRRLTRLMTWRNKIAHSDFVYTPDELQKVDGIQRPQLIHARDGRDKCHQLARAMDRIAGDYLQAVIGSRPW